MIDVSAVRLALVDALSDLHAAINVYELVPAHPTVPCLLIYPPDTIDYMKTRTLDIAVYSVVVLVGPRDPTAQEVLEGFMSGTGHLSIREALYTDRQLGGVVSNLRLMDMTSGAYSLNTGGDDSVIGAEFRVEITA